ncbi:MAG: hypothetical protein EOP84_23875 [Verrucomicrobiaceae bacterium]|nr:MAG: hypothetical protein EOP84_23875 [Verrucomicrobiaceae bacterium]
MVSPKSGKARIGAASLFERSTVHLLWGVVAVVTFCIGFSFSDSPAIPGAPRAASSGGSEPVISEASHRSQSAEWSLGGGDRSEAQMTEQIRAHTFELLAEPNRVTRMRKLCDMLDAVSASNWHEVVDAFEIQMKTEGRHNNDNWDLVLERIGEVAGAAALGEALNPDKPVDRHRVIWLLKGWLAADPNAGIAWFETQPEEVKGWLHGEFVTGISRADPKRALELAVAGSKEKSPSSTPWIVANAIQRGGLRGGEQLLEDISTRPDITNGTKCVVFDTLAQRKIAMLKGHSDPASEALDWYERYVGLSFGHTSASRDLIKMAAASDPKKVMSWLSERAGSLTAAQSATAFPVAAREFYDREPAQFTEWMDLHPDHPQRGVMAEAAATSLLRAGKIQDAQRWLQIVTEPQVRSRLDAAVQQAGSSQREAP